VQARAGVVSGDDGLQVVALPPFLLAIVAVGGQSGRGSDLLGLVCDSLLDIGAIHHREGGSVGGDRAIGVERDKP
jgi:hypothetical protein